MNKSKFQAITDAFAIFLALVAALALTLMIATMLWDVLRRATTGRSVAGVYDFVEILLIITAFLAIPLAQLDKQHIKIELITKTRNTTGRQIICHLIVLSIVIWMIYATTSEAIHSYQINETTIGIVNIHQWPARMAISIGLTAFALQITSSLLASCGSRAPYRRRALNTPEPKE